MIGDYGGVVNTMPEPTLRAFAIAQMLLAAQWGVFGATFFLFALEKLVGIRF